MSFEVGLSFEVRMNMSFRSRLELLSRGEVPSRHDRSRLEFLKSKSTVALKLFVFRAHVSSIEL